MRDKLKMAAAKGFAGYGALLDPDAYADHVISQMPSMGPSGGELIAQNENTIFGIPLKDRLTTRIQKEQAPPPQAAEEYKFSGQQKRSAARAKRNEELSHQGMSYQDIMADELANPMD